MKTKILTFCALFSLLTYGQTIPDLISDSTIARFRYELKESTVPWLESSLLPENIDISQRDLLQTVENHTIVSEGINGSSEAFFQIKTLSSTEYEDWMSTPDLILITPRAGYGYTQNELQYHFPHSDMEIQQRSEHAGHTEAAGYTPIMLFFPNMRDAFIEQAQMDGATFTELTDHAFTLSWTDREMTFYPNESRIDEVYATEDEYTETKRFFQLFAPYGYVEIFREENTTRINLPNPVTFSKYSKFSNHVIEDPNNIVRKYTEEAFILVYPSPIENEYEVVLRGIPNDEVSHVQVRDYMGNIVHTHNSPTIDGNVVLLNGSSYPSGVLILIVYTNSGVYTETILKS